jgi:hypothetical protein
MHGVPGEIWNNYSQYMSTALPLQQPLRSRNTTRSLRFINVRLTSDMALVCRLYAHNRVSSRCERTIQGLGLEQKQICMGRIHKTNYVSINRPKETFVIAIMNTNAYSKCVLYFFIYFTNLDVRLLQIQAAKFISLQISTSNSIQWNRFSMHLAKDSSLSCRHIQIIQ